MKEAVIGIGTTAGVGALTAGITKVAGVLLNKNKNERSGQKTTGNTDEDYVYLDDGSKYAGKSNSKATSALTQNEKTTEKNSVNNKIDDEETEEVSTADDSN